MNEVHLRSLQETDRECSLSAPDLDAFLSFVADDVLWLFCGKAAVREHYESVFGRPEFHLTWSADGLHVSDDGTLGYAYGIWTAGWREASGELKAIRGPYATVWRRDASGWRVVLEADY